jgi:peptidoglycan/LPS O-acetylase OafA/YrhL
MLAKSPITQFASIQILRAVAAIMIALHHGLHEADQAARKIFSSSSPVSSWSMPRVICLARQR